MRKTYVSEQEVSNAALRKIKKLYAQGILRKVRCGRRRRRTRIQIYASEPEETSNAALRKINKHGGVKVSTGV